MHTHRAAVGGQRGEQVQPADPGAQLVCRPEGGQAVHQDDDPRLARSIGQAPVVGDRGRTGRRVAHRPSVDRLAQEHQQTGEALVIGAGHDAPHVRQGLQHGQGAAAEVDAVDIAGSAGCREPGRERDGPQEHALARTAGAKDREVALLVRVECNHRLGLAVRIVSHAECQLVVPDGRQSREVVHRAQLRQPGHPWGRQLSGSGRNTDGRYQALKVRRAEVRQDEVRHAMIKVVILDWQLPRQADTVGKRLDPDLGRRGRVGGPATGIPGLERREPPRPAPGHRAPG